MRKLAIDASSFLWRALLAGTDREAGIKTYFADKEVTVNSANYGYENITNMMVSLLKALNFQPVDVILVFEGRSSKSRRVMMDSTYKGGGEASHPPEAYAQFQFLRERIGKVWRDLGSTAVVQDFAEGDDTLAWLAREFPGELTIATYDNDISALNTEEGATNAYGGTCKVWVDGLLGMCKYGTFEFRRVHIYKTLVGDTSDKIKGCVNFGPSAFFKLVDLVGWDGIDELEEMLERSTLGDLHALAEEDSKLGKAIKKIVASEDSVIKAWKVVKLRPEWANTLKDPLQIIAGKVAPLPADADERLVDWYGSNYLITADNYQDGLDTLRYYGAQSRFTAFDIETSTPDESDDWLRSLPQEKGGGLGVDTIGSVLTGFSLTFGANLQHTVYVSVDHANTNNISMSQARKFLEVAWDLGLSNVIHNTFFEFPVLYNAQDEDGSFWRDHWAKNGYHGFVPRALDTKLEASYVDENSGRGLKDRSLHLLNYTQETYEQTTCFVGLRGRLPPGGQLLSEELVGDLPQQTRQYKMNELSAEHVFGYGCDDTICTAALHVYYELVMHLEHTWQPYLDEEIDSAYLHAKSFVDGVTVSIEKSQTLRGIDDKTHANAWTTLRAYLIAQGWQGTQPPTYTPEISAKEIKEAYAIVTDQIVTDEDDEEEVAADDPDSEAAADAPAEVKDSILKTRVRTPSKFPALLRSEGHEVFASMLERCLGGDGEAFTTYVRSYFKGEPSWKFGNKNMSKLLYSVMNCPIQVRGKATETMRSKGIRQGNPKADALAIEYALRDMAGDAEAVAVLKALKLMQMVRTRRSFYYSKYPAFVHWKTGKVHSSHNQSSTNTRRASSSRPNLQQLPKHPKIVGEPAKFREVIVPHAEDAVIVSIDFDSQELRIIADYSKDENMVACFVGDHLKSMHSLTGNSILQKRRLRSWSYEEFEAAYGNPEHPDAKLLKEYRALGKKVNFTTEFGAMAPKLAQTMLCSEAEAQVFIDAKEEMFPGAVAWKDRVVKEVYNKGYVLLKSGARRHLRDALVSRDKWVQSKAERQAVNAMVQGTGAGMTKRAESRMWQAGLAFDYDAQYVGPIHDECVWSVLTKDLHSFIPKMHACMATGYGDMFIPIEGSISFGPSFGEQIEIGLVPSAKAIDAGLAKLH